MAPERALLGLDIGEKRIGVAWSAAGLLIAVPLMTLQVDFGVAKRICELAAQKEVTTVIVGLPRNQQGEETAQSRLTRQFAAQLERQGLEVIFQDESLTSQIAESSLKESGKPYQKEDIDKLAATYILRDYLETERAGGGHQKAN